MVQKSYLGRDLMRDLSSTDEPGHGSRRSCHLTEAELRPSLVSDDFSELIPSGDTFVNNYST